mgnify:CR=1 FL=1
MENCKKPSDNKKEECFTISKSDSVYDLNGNYKGQVYKREGAIVFYECAAHGTKYALLKDYNYHYIIVAIV